MTETPARVSVDSCFSWFFCSVILLWPLNMTRRYILEAADEACEVSILKSARSSDWGTSRRICEGIKMLIKQAGCNSCFKPHEICMALYETYAGRAARRHATERSRDHFTLGWAGCDCNPWHKWPSVNSLHGKKPIDKCDVWLKVPRETGTHRHLPLKISFTVRATVQKDLSLNLKGASYKLWLVKVFWSFGTKTHCQSVTDETFYTAASFVPPGIWFYCISWITAHVYRNAIWPQTTGGEETGQLSARGTNSDNINFMKNAFCPSVGRLHGVTGWGSFLRR